MARSGQLRVIRIKMKIKSQRKYAAFLSGAAAIGNLGIIVVCLQFIDYKDYIKFLTSGLTTQFIILSMVMFMALSVYLLSQIIIPKRVALTLLYICIVWMGVASFLSQVSMLMAIFLPWALFKIYRAEAV